MGSFEKELKKFTETKLDLVRVDVATEVDFFLGTDFMREETGDRVDDFDFERVCECVYDLYLNADTPYSIAVITEAALRKMAYDLREDNEIDYLLEWYDIEQYVECLVMGI